MQRRFDPGKTPVDLDCGLLRADALEIFVGPGVMADGVACGGDLVHQLRLLGGGLADHEKGGAHALLRQRGENPFVHRRCGPIVEGQHHLALPERQRLGKALQADTGIGCGVHRHDTRGAERVPAVHAAPC